MEEMALLDSTKTPSGKQYVWGQEQRLLGWNLLCFEDVCIIYFLSLNLEFIYCQSLDNLVFLMPVNLHVKNKWLLFWSE